MRLPVPPLPRHAPTSSHTDADLAMPRPSRGPAWYAHLQMAERTRYDRVRRLLGLVAVAAAVTLLIREDCKREARTAATLRLHLGAAAADVRAVRVDLFDVRGGSAGFFERAYPSGAPDTVVVPVEIGAAGEYQVELLIDRAGGPARLTRTLALEDGASVSVELEAALAAPRAPPAD